MAANKRFYQACQNELDRADESANASRRSSKEVSVSVSVAVEREERWAADRKYVSAGGYEIPRPPSMPPPPPPQMADG